MTHSDTANADWTNLQNGCYLRVCHITCVCVSVFKAVESSTVLTIL